MQTDQKPTEEHIASELGALVCYAANATAGRGGQGEFLRQMMYALDQFPQGRILSRGAHASHAECADIQLQGWRGLGFRSIAAWPVLRGRSDLLTLLSDVDFDSQLSRHLADVELFDGVMGQCCLTFERLRRKNIPLVLTTLNTHIDNVEHMLTDERRRLGIDFAGLHPPSHAGSGAPRNRTRHPHSSHFRTGEAIFR